MAWNEEWEMRQSGGGVSEIQEEVWSEELDNNNVNGGNRVYELGSIGEELEENAVYVAVWKESDETLSMDALLWTLNNALLHPSSALVILVHVFSQAKYIPTPLGKLPINQVNPEQKEKFLAQESGKRRDLLQKFLNVCSTSQVYVLYGMFVFTTKTALTIARHGIMFDDMKVKVDTVLIESDMEAKAILDLIPILNIRKLVLGASRTTVRRMRSKKGNGAADQIVQNAPELCEVKIICQGKEMSELTIMESPPPSPSPSPTHSTPKFAQTHQQTTTDSFACGCFKI